jgi:hypothetical protein
MNATAVGALSSPAAIGARLVDARLASRRVRVVARRGRNSSTAHRRFGVIADATSDDADADQAAGAAAVLAGVAAAAAIAVAGPARGADFEFIESARAAGVSAPDGSATIVLQAPQSFVSNAPHEDRPVVDAAAHTRYLDALDARGIEPGKITYVGGVPQHPKGLSRFGSAATAADETASLVSTGFALLIFAALGAAGNRDGSGSGGVRKSNPKPSKPSKPFTATKTKTNTAKTTRGVDGGRRLFSGGAASRPGGGFGRGGGFGGGPRAPAPAPAPAAQAAVALATTVVVGSIASVGGGGGGVVGGGGVGVVGGPSAPAMTATATTTTTAAETELAVAAAAGAAVLGATVVGSQRFDDKVKSNIVAYGKPATAPTPKAKTTVISKPKPPRKPPSKLSTAERDAASSNPSSETLSAIAAFGVGVFVLASVSSAPPSAPPREAFEVERKRPAEARVSTEKPFAKPPTTTTAKTRRGSKLDGDAVMPLVAVVLLIAAGATVAGVGLEDEETTETEEKTLETLRATVRSDEAGAARRAAEAQRWIDDWKRERASSAAAMSSTSISSSSTFTSSSSVSGPKTSYYEVIDGVKYDRKVLDACRRSEAEDGFISLDEAKAILTDVVDGPTRPVVRADGRTLASSVTNVEIDTAAYALRTFRWTSAARKWFTRAMETIDAPDAEAIREDGVKTFTAKELTSTDAKTKTKTKTTEANATDATSATRPARRGASAYETIDGVRYDRATLDVCRACTEEDGFISLAEAKSVYEGLVGGPVRKVTRRDGSVVKSSITNVELDTAQYIFLHFKWSEPAKKWFADKFVNLDRQ